MIQVCLVCAFAALLIFAVYNYAAIRCFGIPKTLSETFYLWQDVKKGYGAMFTAMMFSVAIILMPAWIEISETIGGWEHNFTFLAFLAAGSIAFVGAAPAFRSCTLESKVHSIAAKCAAVFSLLWCGVICWRIAYIVPIAVAVVWGVAFATKTAKRCSVYWWEMCAFVATFATIITECAILM